MQQLPEVDDGQDGISEDELDQDPNSLRNIPLSDTFFWRPSYREQVDLRVEDFRTETRRLTGSETAVMALNEIAVHHGRGYFFHLASPVSWRKGTSKHLEDKVPAARSPPTPGAGYASIAYINFRWSTDSCKNFRLTQHRSRYLASDGIINPPLENTPIYPIQYCSHAQDPLFETTPPSLILLAGHSAYYLAKTNKLKVAWQKMRKSARKPGGTDAHLRLKIPPDFWKGGEAAQSRDPLQGFRLDNLEAVYQQVVASCVLGELDPSFTAADFSNRIPRPVGGAEGVALGRMPKLAGSPAEDESSSDRRPGRWRGKRRRDDAGDVVEEEEEEEEEEEGWAAGTESMEDHAGVKTGKRRSWRRAIVLDDSDE